MEEKIPANYRVICCKCRNQVMYPLSSIKFDGKRAGETYYICLDCDAKTKVKKYAG